MNARIEKIVTVASEGGELARDDIAFLVNLDPASPESYYVMAAGREMTRRASGGLAEVHAQIGLNLAPCPMNCDFCSFAAKNKVFTKPKELPIAQAVQNAAQFEKDGANAVLLMTTADYPLAKYLEVAREVRANLRPETILVANVGDVDGGEAQKLKDAGFSGVYHALRLGEGRDTRIPPERRLRSFAAFREAGLKLGTCVEPVGPEHTTEEIVEKTLIGRDASPCYSGAARRITVPGSKLAKHGMITELRMAHLVAVVRLAMGLKVIGNCTHEPCVIGAAAGANLMWAEVGSNPRDTQEETAQARGMTVQRCRQVFREAGWDVLNGPSRIYRGE